MSDVAPRGDAADFIVCPKDRNAWSRQLRVTASLLAVWFVASFGLVFFARELDFLVLGWPLSFWMGAQGSLLIFVGIVWYYAIAMDRHDEQQRGE